MSVLESIEPLLVQMQELTVRVDEHTTELRSLRAEVSRATGAATTAADISGSGPASMEIQVSLTRPLREVEPSSYSSDLPPAILLILRLAGTELWDGSSCWFVWTLCFLTSALVQFARFLQMLTTGTNFDLNEFCKPVHTFLYQDHIVFTFIDVCGFMAMSFVHWGMSVVMRRRCPRTAVPRRSLYRCVAIVVSVSVIYVAPRAMIATHCKSAYWFGGIAFFVVSTAIVHLSTAVLVAMECEVLRQGLGTLRSAAGDSSYARRNQMALLAHAAQKVNVDAAIRRWQVFLCIHIVVQGATAVIDGFLGFQDSYTDHTDLFVALDAWTAFVLLSGILVAGMFSIASYNGAVDEASFCVADFEAFQRFRAQPLHFSLFGVVVSTGRVRSVVGSLVATGLAMFVRRFFHT